MKRRVLLSRLAMVALGAFVGDNSARGGFRLNISVCRVSVPDIGPVGIVNGQPCVLKKERAGEWAMGYVGGRRSREYPWEPTGPGWILRGDRISTNTRGDRGLTLAYDPDGKDKAVVLSNNPGAGSRWTVGATIQAAEGKLSGWYLDYDPELKLENDAGYRLILSPKPGRIKQLSIEKLGQLTGHK